MCERLRFDCVFIPVSLGWLLFSVSIFHPALWVLLTAPLPSSVAVCLLECVLPPFSQDLLFLFEALSSQIPSALDVSPSV